MKVKKTRNIITILLLTGVVSVSSILGVTGTSEKHGRISRVESILNDEEILNSDHAIDDIASKYGISSSVTTTDSSSIEKMYKILSAMESDPENKEVYLELLQEYRGDLCEESKELISSKFGEDIYSLKKGQITTYRKISERTDYYTVPEVANGDAYWDKNGIFIECPKVYEERTDALGGTYEEEYYQVTRVEENYYHISYDDKDLDILIDAISHRNDSKYFTPQRVKLIISAYLNVLEKDYSFEKEDSKPKEKTELIDGIIETRKEYKAKAKSETPVVGDYQVDDVEGILSYYESIVKNKIIEEYNLDITADELEIYQIDFIYCITNPNNGNVIGLDEKYQTILRTIDDYRQELEKYKPTDMIDFNQNQFEKELIKIKTL